MSLLVDLAWVLVGLVVALGAYGGLCLGLLFSVDYAEDVPYAVLEDAAFAIAFPFVLAVLVITVARRP